jgi:transposase
MSEEAGQQGASINAQGRVFERGKRLSDDVILWVVTLFKKKGHSPAEIASTQGITPASVSKVIGIYGECCCPAEVRAAHPQRGGARKEVTKIGDAERGFLYDLCYACPALELADYQGLLRVIMGVQVTEQHIGKVLTKELRLTRKKLTHYYAQRLTPHNVARTRQYLEDIRHYDLEQLRYFDECAVGSRGLHTRYGRALSGERAVAELTNASWGRISVNALLSIRPDDPAVYWDAVQRSTYADDLLEFFRGAVSERALRRGDVVIMDNCQTHHQHEDELMDILNAAGVALLFLPPYSPFLNPIELFFNTLKGRLRRCYSTSDEATALESIASAMEDTASTASNAGYYRKCVRSS